LIDPDKKETNLPCCCTWPRDQNGARRWEKPTNPSISVLQNPEAKLRIEELESAKSEENVAPVWAPIFKAMDLAIAVIEKD
jgi:hypothetical protein